MKSLRYDEGVNFLGDLRRNWSGYFAGILLIWRPFLVLYALGSASTILLYYSLCRLTCRIRIQHPENRQGPCISVFWHRYFNFYFTGFLSLRGQVMLSHPKPYMSPWYCLGKMMGLSVMIPGSTGNRGREAAEEMMSYLKNGYSSSITPDGPAGPPMQLKKGILHLATESKLPVVPMSFRWKRCMVLPTWDRKIYPIPFISSFEITLHKPLKASDFTNLEEFAGRLTQCLSET